MLRSVSEACQPLRGEQHLWPCTMHLLRGSRNDASYPSSWRSLSPLQVAGLQVRTVLPQTNLKWLIFCFPEGNKP